MRPYARSLPGQVLKWSIDPIAVDLQTLGPIREEEGGPVLWRRRALSELGGERPWHGTATISVLRPRLKIGAAEVDRVRGRLGNPRALGAQLQGKGVRGNDFRAKASWSGNYFASMYIIFRVPDEEKG